MTKLSVNVNKIATLRNTRKLNLPNVSRFARLALEVGAHGITVHPRPDRRHIRPEDVVQIAALITEFPDAEFNIEGNPFIDYLPHIQTARPTQATLVPDEVDSPTSDHGFALDNPSVRQRLKPVIREIQSLGTRVSLFVDAVPEQMKMAADLGADRIELYTEPYAAKFALGEEHAADAYAATAQAASEAGLIVNAGHDLNLANLPPLLKAVPQIAEVSISHALTADALEFGFEQTVRLYLAACQR